MEPNYFQFFAALLFVIGLIWLAAAAFKQMSMKGPLFQSKLLRSPARRMKHVETLPLDARNRLVLVTRDNKEYMLLVGMQGSIVIDQYPASSTPPASP
jgi:flagellar biogenesis protein FliO